MEENEGLEFREIGGLARVLVSWLELGSGSPDPVQAYFQFTRHFMRVLQILRFQITSHCILSGAQHSTLH